MSISAMAIRVAETFSPVESNWSSSRSSGSARPLWASGSARRSSCPSRRHDHVAGRLDHRGDAVGGAADALGGGLPTCRRISGPISRLAPWVPPPRLTVPPHVAGAAPVESAWLHARRPSRIDSASTVGLREERPCAPASSGRVSSAGRGSWLGGWWTAPRWRCGSGRSGRQAATTATPCCAPCRDLGQQAARRWFHGSRARHRRASGIGRTEVPGPRRALTQLAPRQAVLSAWPSIAPGRISEAGRRAAVAQQQAAARAALLLEARGRDESHSAPGGWRLRRGAVDGRQRYTSIAHRRGGARPRHDLDGIAVSIGTWTTFATSRARQCAVSCWRWWVSPLGCTDGDYPSLSGPPYLAHAGRPWLCSSLFDGARHV